MSTFKIRLLLYVSLVLTLFMLSGCGSQVTSTPSVAGPTAPPTRTATPRPAPPIATGQATEESSGSSLSDLLEGLPTRTPEPTATPDVVAETVAELLMETGLAQRTLFFVRYAVWINLGISLLYIVVGYLIGTWLIRWLFPRLVQRTKTQLDDRLLQASGNQIRWLAVLLILRNATNRLTFVNATTKTTLGDIYFFLALYLLVLLLFRLINLGGREAEERARITGRTKELDPLIMLAMWASRLLVLLLAISLSLSHFGVNVTGVALFIGLVGLVITLAGRDILADFIAGAFILIDRPYRIGDRVDLPSMNTWGDVFDISMRSTRIRAIDNRMVILPNSEIGKSQIINYSYTDTSFFDQCDVLVAYNNDLDAIGQLLIDTIGTVEGVMTEREIGAWLMTFREYSAVFTVAWWIESYTQRYDVHDRVTKAIARALREAGAAMPYRLGNLNVELNNADQGPFPDAGDPSSSKATGTERSGQDLGQ